MFLLPKSSFNELADFRSPNCISVFLPTHRAGMEVNQREDEILFKNLLRDVANALVDRGFSKLQIEDYLHPAQALLNNSFFWNHMSDGLAVFIGERFFQHYELPVHFEPHIYLADHFYLRPLMPLYNDDGRFFLLALSLDELRFFEGSRHSISEVYVEDVTPQRLEEVVGYDYEQKSLQFRSAQGGPGRAMFHGRGEGKDEVKTEVKEYFKAVNDGLMQILRHETAPLLIACVDQWFPIYREVNTYSHLYEEHLSGNPDREHTVILHERAWEKIAPHFRQVRQDKLREFEELKASGRVSTQAVDILPAALSGRIDTLFLQNRADAYGNFNPETLEIHWDEEKLPDNQSLFNLAAIHTFRQGGKVFLMEPEEMPVPNTLANAIFRF